VDDIGDGDLDREARFRALQDERRLVSELATGGFGDPADPVSVALAHALAVYDLPLDALQSLIDGVERDVLGTRFETFDELETYCRQVAGSIGRLCLAIFRGHKEPSVNGSGSVNGAAGLADDLGVAMQLTNILRDVREDRDRGRTYLPVEDLRRFGAEDLEALSVEQTGELIRYEAARASAWFDRGLPLVDQLDRRSGSCVLAMTGIYRSILERIAQEPTEILHRRVSLPAREKVWVAARSLTGRPVLGNASQMAGGRR
jgi:phytoene synthase